MHYNLSNINEAFRTMVSFFNKDGGAKYLIESTKSRNGNVLSFIEPVTLTYDYPTQRVLFNVARDANPFFHLYESLWMLAGREDVAPLAYYASKISQYSDDGKIFNGAYGARWKGKLYDTDQLIAIIDHLEATPNSRRAVLQMWDVEQDLLKVNKSLDCCCNLNVLFTIREGKLDMTVFNRSNDLILGCLGANYVHFTFLQEYVADKLEVEVGKYHQVSNNLHVYDWNWKPEEWLADETPDYYNNFNLSNLPRELQVQLWGKHFRQVPLEANTPRFDDELSTIVDDFSKGLSTSNVRQYKNKFFNDTVLPMLRAFRYYKAKEYSTALSHCLQIESDDWKIAAYTWIHRRMVKNTNKGDE